MRPRPAVMPTFGVRTSDPKITVKRTTWYHGVVSRKLLTKFVRRKSKGHLTASRNHWALASAQSTIWSNQYPIGSCHWSRTAVSERPTPVASLKPDFMPAAAARIPLTGTPLARSHQPTVRRAPSPP